MLKCHQQPLCCVVRHTVFGMAACPARLIQMPKFYEFFAGGGMARAGLGRNWDCLFANDIDVTKGASYKANWGADHLKIADVAALTSADLPGQADLAWASFPCQDLSLAGDYAGLNGKRSGTFWRFWRLVEILSEEKRAPSLIVLENVCGAITSHGGSDFAAIAGALHRGGYLFGALVIDAARFVPQSRPRLFVVAARRDLPTAAQLVDAVPGNCWYPRSLLTTCDSLPPATKESWLWWRLPEPPPRTTRFSDMIEAEPGGVRWHTTAETQKLIGMMSPANRGKLDRAIRMGTRVVGGIYRRTRVDDKGRRVQRAEVRFDDMSGCLRTPAGGSSRQTIMIVEGDRVRSRLLSPREAARLMGLPEGYLLPENYNDAYCLAGDGVVVPVVRFLAKHLLEPLVGSVEDTAREAA
ncbi:MAG: DNA cytosine methyltransferase [Bryobacteraceae bacterium]